jgi:hypothetical protein
MKDSATALLNPSRFLRFTLSQAETHPSPSKQELSLIETLRGLVDSGLLVTKALNLSVKHCQQWMARNWEEETFA